MFLYNYIYTLLLVFCLFLGKNAFGQSYMYNNFSIEAGLPSSETYMCLQDSKGYMWFATDAGAVRYDGYEFRTFNRLDGLVDNTVFIVYEDYKNRIWFGTFSGQLSYYLDGKIYPYKYNNRLNSAQKNSTITSISIDSTDNLWIGFRSAGIIKIDSAGTVTNQLEVSPPENIHIKIIAVNGVDVWGIQNNKNALNQKTVRISYSSGAHNYTYVKNDYTNHATNPSYNWHLSCHNQRILFNLSDSLFSLRKQEGKVILKSFESQVFQKSTVFSYHSAKGYLWLSTNNNGVFKCIIDHDSIQVVSHYLKGKPISRVTEDRSGGLWFQSIEEGIFYLPSDKFKYFPYKNLKVTSIETDQETGAVYILYSDGLIARITADNQLDSIAQVSNYSNIIFKNYVDDYLFLGSLDRQMYIYRNNKVELIDDVSTINAKDFLIDKDLVYLVAGSQLLVLKNNKNYLVGDDIKNNSVWGTSLLKQGENIWIGTKEGIKLYRNRAITAPFQNHPLLSSYITSLVRLGGDTVLVGTKSFGLFIMKGVSILETISLEDGLLSNIVREIHVDYKHNIWVGTNKGLSRITYNGVGDYKIRNLTQINGLISNEITVIKSYKNDLYVGSNKGLIKFDTDNIDINQQPPVLEFTSFSVNSQLQDDFSFTKFRYDQNFIKIKFLALNYISAGMIKYKYRMLGIDSNWTTTYSRLVQYPILSPNDYQFEVKAMNEDGIWSSSKKLQFRISKPFWLNWWFIGAAAAVMLLFIIYLVKSRENKINEQAALQTQIIDLELRSLRSQMNPHFIFNTLNTIQSAINTLDIRFASDYVSRFGKLIRLVLESSKKSKVTFSTEIEMLRLYVHLEGLRFSNKFSFRVDVDENIDEELLEIPSMVIQPFVENAILHGLTPKSGNDLLLTLSFEMLDKNTLCCIVEDNGIGRVASAAIKQSKQLQHHSMGLEITQQRLNLYFKETGNKFSFDIRDLKDNNNQASGTKVEIIFAV